MIVGVGIDIVKIDRLRKSVENVGRKFLERVFTAAEMAYCTGKRDPYPSFSARFAAKEALVKALAAENPVSLRDIEVLNAPSGSPMVQATGTVRDLLDEKAVKATHLSMSHEKDYAVACVVLES